jgi:hypothetical protein
MVSDYTLDLGALNRIILEESRKPAQLIVSKYEDNINGNRSWVQEWEILDADTGDSLNLEYPLRSRHFMPSGKINNRRGRSYFKCILGFANCQYNGSQPEEFLGARCWIEEVRNPYKDREGNDREQVWWLPISAFTPGEPLDMGDNLEVTSEYLNPPSTNGANEDVYQRMAELINGKTHRAAMDAIGKDPVLSVDDDFMKLVQSGEAFNEVVNLELVEQVNNRYQVV